MNNSEENILARDKAIRYIGISKKTEYEVKKKLKGLKIASSVIDEEIEYLKELGYIDDLDYVKSYIRQCEKLQNYSIYEITNKLLQKGIKTSIMEQEIDVLKETDYEEKVIGKLIKGKLKSYDEMKQKNYLYRRGFRI
ncbi:MAG: RecX family transcriptional regulator [Clostridia bacterium]|nr:RecX family transcriptional regulator [Clostridia bacterium]